MSKKSQKFQVLPADIQVDFNAEESILEVLLSHKVDINHSCEGNGTCTTCRVIVKEGLESLPPRGPVEQDIIEDRGFEENERLACQTKPCSGIKILIP